MFLDIDAALQGWDYKPGMVQARLVQRKDGRHIIQMRVDLGVLQLEPAGRPDGSRPHNHATYFDYLRHQANIAQRVGQSFTLSEEHCDEADREFTQYYYRRISWLALRNYRGAVADADHTLAFMDFVRDHSPGEDYTFAHERHRGIVLFHRTEAAAKLAAEQNDPEGAIDELRAGLQKIQSFFATYSKEEEMEEDGMVRELRSQEESLRKLHNIRATLREQLEQAVANEQYETAARLRDALQKRRR
jgi:hypothetical protein